MRLTVDRVVLVLVDVVSGVPGVVVAVFAVLDDENDLAHNGLRVRYLNINNS